MDGPCLRIPAESEQASGRPWSGCCSLSLLETELGYSGALRVSVSVRFCCRGLPCLIPLQHLHRTCLLPRMWDAVGRMRALEDRTQETFPTAAHRPSWLLASFRWGGLQRAPEARGHSGLSAAGTLPLFGPCWGPPTAMVPPGGEAGAAGSRGD